MPAVPFEPIDHVVKVERLRAMMPDHVLMLELVDDFSVETFPHFT